MSPERRQWILGAAALVVLGIALWSLWSPATPARTTAPARARGSRPSANSSAAAVADTIKLDALRASHEDPGDAGRNPFRYEAKAAPPSASTARPTTPIVTETPRPAPAVPTGPPPPPPIPLKLLGFLERADGVKWAVLSDGKSAPMYGKDGDIIDGKYLIVKIGTESIEMTHSDGRGRQVIRQTGQ